MVGHIPTPARYLVSVGTPRKANPLGTSSVTAGVLPPGAAGGGEPPTLSLHATVHHEAHPCEPRGLSPGRGARMLPVRRPPGDRAPSARLRSPRRLADAPHVRGSPSHVTPRASSAAARTRRRRSLAPACGHPGFLGVTSASSGRADRRCRLRTRFSRFPPEYLEVGGDEREVIESLLKNVTWGLLSKFEELSPHAHVQGHYGRSRVCYLAVVDIHEYMCHHITRF